PGQLLFFYNKVEYLLKRDEEVTQRILDRSLSEYSDMVHLRLVSNDIPEVLRNDWEPSQEELEKNRHYNIYH
ncbi:unnamed protein product, partial [Sphagnum compactum]